MASPVAPHSSTFCFLLSNFKRRRFLQKTNSSKLLLIKYDRIYICDSHKNLYNKIIYEMKNLKQIIFSVLFILPLTALASGQEVIFVASFELILILIVCIILWNLKINRKGKLILAIIYILSSYLTLHFVDTGAYFENLMLTNLSVAIIPTLIFYSAYLLLKNKFKK